MTTCPIAPAPCFDRLSLCWPSMVDEDLWNYDLVRLEGLSEECVDLVFTYGWRVSTGEHWPSPGWLLEVPSHCNPDFRERMGLEWMGPECAYGKTSICPRSAQERADFDRRRGIVPKSDLFQPGSLSASILEGALLRAMSAAQGAFKKP